MSRPRALDLFCGQGGASMGLSRAGFEVHGVDIDPQPRYPFAFTRADALAYPLDGFDLIWASPPCQRYSMYSRNMGTSENHPDLVAPMRDRLNGYPHVIENVPGAPLRTTIMLCGSMFRLAVRRHRNFECSWPIALGPASCNHDRSAIPVFGHGTPQWHRQKFGRNISIEEKRAAMGIDWMTREGLSEAIPPAYSEWLGRTYLAHAK